MVGERGAGAASRLYSMGHDWKRLGSSLRANDGRAEEGEGSE